MPSFDYAVIGAGVFGAWLARALHLRGRRVVLIDQYGPANARASSGGETRILRMGYGNKAIYTQWSWRALKLYRDFDPTLFQTTGCLWLTADPTETATTLANNAIPHEVLNAETIGQRFPQFQIEDNTQAIYEPAAGVLLARRGVQTVVHETIKLGLDYRQTQSPPEAATYIYACGPWLPKLFPELLRDRIVPTRQEVFYFGTPPGDANWRPPAMPCWIDTANSIYGTPDIEHRGFKVALDKHGPAIDPDTEPRTANPPATNYLAERFPQLANAPLIHAEVCQYENTATGDYLIDRHPGKPNVWLLGGGSGHGYKHGPVIAEYLTAALEDGAPIDPIFSLAAKTNYYEGIRTSTI